MLQIYNSLGRELQEFKPFNDNNIGVYTCGPTVYDYVTIGNWRTYTLSDLTVRTLKYLGHNVKLVMNITDVGHLTGDNEGDASSGEDRMEKAERKEGKTAWEIANFYAKDFIAGISKLNLIMPDVLPKATDHIEEQIKLIQEIEEKGLTYKISDGIYFDTKKYDEMGNKYGEISNLDQIKEGARVAVNEEKKDPRDFALWKFSPKDKKRHMEWESPWGIGFPGWHIECSAMSMKYLGEQFDLHLGGEDLKSTHHPGEIAQSEAATDKKPFVKYWMHGAFLQVDGGRMGKSLGNAYTLQNIEDKGFQSLDLRYFYLTGHYRSPINFTWESLTAAKNAREKLVKKLASIEKAAGSLSEEHKKHFVESLEDDLNMPKALAVVWEVLKSDLSDQDKLATILDFDKVLGLNLEHEVMVREPHHDNSESYSPEVKELIDRRYKARAERNWKVADEIRDRLKNEFGVEVVDK